MPGQTFVSVAAGRRRVNTGLWPPALPYTLSMLRYRITADAYHKMAEAGLIGGDERTELLEGELYRMRPIGPQHLRAVGRLNAALIHALGDKAFVSV